MLRQRTLVLAVVVTCAFASGFARPANAESYTASGTIHIGGTGHWDLVATDPGARRAYVAHNVNVNVVDTASEKPVGVIHTTGYAHGIALAPSLGLGFITVGKSTVSPVAPQHEVDVFSLKTMRITKRIPTKDDPDAITYDAFTNRIFVANAEPAIATVIDAVSGKIITKVPLGGHPEFPISDGAGHVFFNINDTNKIVVFDSQKATIVQRWSLGACEGPTATAYDAGQHRLLVPCDNGKLVVIDARSGDVVATVPIGEGPDGVAWDAATKTVFVSTLRGALTVAREDNGRYVVIQTLKLPLGSRTLALDAKTHKVYVPSSKFAPKPPGQKYPTPIAGAFGLIVVSK